ncbi:MAG TPA: hypothetical protein VNL95_09510 [Dehalococcoidia bacterium]|nr:hypothetical protein [Dehalococcoidia bacterium]
MSRRERRRSRRAQQRREDTHPLSFWRRGQPRTGRPPQPRTPQPRAGIAIYLPPWLPVAIIAVAVVAIFLALVLFREAGAISPKMGDHWHARYEIWICGVKQPNIPVFAGGVHTHGDGYIHIHPENASEEGRGARLVKFFEYAGRALGRGGILTPDTLQVPGDTRVFRNGDTCGEGPFQGQQGQVQVLVNGQPRADFEDYVPRDGDEVIIVFGPPGAAPTPPAGPTPPRAPD